MSELMSQFGVHATLIARWKKQLKESAPGIFYGEIKTQEAQRDKEIHDLHAKIG